MAPIVAALLALFLGTVRADAQLVWEYIDRSPEPIIGLLDLPDTIGDGCGSAKKPATLRVFAGPSIGAVPVGTIFLDDSGNAGCWLRLEKVDRNTEEVPVLESGAEIAAAIAYERRGLWFRIALTGGSGWVQRADIKDFLPYPAMLKDRMAYIKEGWDGSLRTTPSRSAPIHRVPAELRADRGGRTDVEYVGSRQVGKDLWLRVRVMKDRGIGDPYIGVPVMSGWLPAHRADGSPSAWFYSRD